MEDNTISLKGHMEVFGARSSWTAGCGWGYNQPPRCHIVQRRRKDEKWEERAFPFPRSPALQPRGHLWLLLVPPGGGVAVFGYHPLYFSEREGDLREKESWPASPWLTLRVHSRTSKQCSSEAPEQALEKGEHV